LAVTVEVNGRDINHVLAILKRETKEIMLDYKKHSAYQKPSEVRREKKMKALRNAKQRARKQKRDWDKKDSDY